MLTQLKHSNSMCPSLSLLQTFELECFKWSLNSNWVIGTCARYWSRKLIRWKCSNGIVGQWVVSWCSVSFLKDNIYLVSFSFFPLLRMNLSLYLGERPSYRYANRLLLFQAFYCIYFQIDALNYSGAHTPLWINHAPCFSFFFLLTFLILPNL